MIPSELIFQLVNTGLLLAGVLFGVQNLKKLSDSRNVDFVINAEGQIDPLHHSLVLAEPSVVRLCYDELLRKGDYSDDEVRAFVFLYYKYLHVARMFYLLFNRSLDLGMSGRERKQLINIWIADLSVYRDNPIMRDIHANAMENEDFNPAFLKAVDRIFSDGRSGV